MRIRVGTSGYSYKEWKGAFYPEDLPAAGMLGFYAQRLGAVEINNTFYRMPKQAVVRKWAEQVPADFSFSLKASQRITHRKRLEDADDELAFVLSNAAELGGKLGPMLFQLPPFLRKGADRLRGFLKLLPEGWRAGFEFRHASWLDEEIFDALRERNVALVVSDTDDDSEAPVVPTANYGYVRLRRGRYDRNALAAWAKRIADQPWDEVHVYFKHEKDGPGPELAEGFRGLF
ncbi:MAG: DUF72 domain-containing protein [Planctomycetota bacterium]|jgi:uncharacterized protein YecE (DUF72 family)